MVLIWNTSCKKCIIWARDIKSMIFKIVITSASKTGNFWGISCLSNKSLSFYLVASVLRQFSMILSPNKLWCKRFFVFCPRRTTPGLRVFIIYYFHIWNLKKERNLIIIRVINSHRGPMYTETHCICTNQNQSWRTWGTKFSGILRYKQITYSQTEDQT